MRIRSTLLFVLFTLASARADVVTEWNQLALDIIAHRSTPPPAASRHLAILHVAIYDAVNGIRGGGTPYLATDKVRKSASAEAAAAAAGHDVLLSLYPMDEPLIETLYQAMLAAIHKGKHKAEGIEWGQECAQLILDDRATDGWNQPIMYVPGSTPGQWRPTISFGGIVRPYLAPHWAFVRPFALETPDQFRPQPPPALESQQYADDVNMVKELGSKTSSTRTADQTEIALFWGYGPNTSTPAGHWNEIAQVVAEQKHNKLEENARLFALLNIAMADAAIVAWDCKLNYNLWRPITAIQEADTDNNTNTVADLTWEPLLQTPPFPEYTSGHSTFSGAAAVVMARFFGKDNIPFTATSVDTPGITRSYSSFSEAAVESGLSRIYGGIHFMSANRVGLSSGAKIGRLVMDQFLVSKHKAKSIKSKSKGR